MPPLKRQDPIEGLLSTIVGSVVAVNCGSISWEGLVVHPCFFVGFFRGDIPTSSEIALVRDSSQYIALAQTLQTNARKKRALVEAFTSGTNPDAASKLKEQRRLKELQQDKIERMDLARAAQQWRYLDPQTCVVLPFGQAQLSAAQKQMLSDLGEIPWIILNLKNKFLKIYPPSN